MELKFIACFFHEGKNQVFIQKAGSERRALGPPFLGKVPCHLPRKSKQFGAGNRNIHTVN